MKARLFASVPVPPGLRSRLAAAGQALARLPGVRAVRDTNLHLTVRFFGMADIEATRRALAVPLPAIPALRAVRYTVFRRGVFLEFAGGGSGLAELCRACGTDPEGFTPHVTVARFRPATRLDRSALPSPPAEPFPVERLDLVRSDLRPGGPIYTTLATLPLANRKSASRSGPNRA